MRSDGKKGLKDCRILIVEDDFYQATELLGQLRSAGVQAVLVTGCVHEAFSCVESRLADLALLDIHLGAENCFDLARALQRRGIPFLFLTGYGKEVLPEDLSGAPFLTKPSDGPTVVAALKEIRHRADDRPTALT